MPLPHPVVATAEEWAEAEQIMSRMTIKQWRIFYILGQMIGRAAVANIVSLMSDPPHNTIGEKEDPPFIPPGRPEMNRPYDPDKPKSEPSEFYGPFPGQ